MRRHVEVDGAWVQKRSIGKEKGYNLCENCKLFKPGRPDNCTRVIGLGNFCAALKMVVVVWSCPEFKVVSDEV